MKKQKMLHIAAAMVVVMVMLVCTFPRLAMAGDASGPGGAGVADSLNATGGAVSLTTVGNATGGTTINGATSITGAATVTGLTTLNGGATVVGTTSINNGANNFATNINSGSSTSAVTIGNAANTTYLNSATNSIGANNAFATTNNIGVSSAAATTNNIGTNAAFASTNALGNTNVGTTVTATGGNSVLSIANTQASLTAGATLATNGTSGTTSGSNSGGLTVYNAAQTIGANTTIQTTLSPNGILNGKTYQNKVNGNLFVDGNVYINGTLDYVSSNSANTTVVGSTGTSKLSSTNGTTAGTAIVMKGSAGTQTVVDGNGKLTNTVTTGASESTAALTLTNGDGNTHGIVVTETQTTMSGGRNSTSLTLHDDGATFANATNGDPVRVHGIDDGTAPNDAVNVRQLGSGLAMVAGLAALPQVDPGKKFAIGLGTGGYMSQVSLAGGVSARIRDNIVIKAGGAFVPGYSGSTQPVWHAGVQYSFF
ncbi:MAG: YadA-like family protein [Syntrophales bacterium]